MSYSSPGAPILSLPGKVLDIGEPKEALTIKSLPSWSLDVSVSLCFVIHVHCPHQPPELDLGLHHNCSGQ